MKNKSVGIVIGILLVIIGIGYIGNIFEVWNFKLFFPGWWTLFLIIPAAVMIARNGLRPINISMLVIGSLLLISQLGIIPDYLSKLVFPVLLLAIGFTVIFRGQITVSAKAKMNRSGPADSYIALLSGRSPNYNGKRFAGAFATAIFGGVDLKLSQATIEDGAVIDALMLFGGVDVVLPSEVNVEISCVPIFGGVSEPKNRTYRADYPTVYINAVCIFGGMDIK